MGLRGVWRVWIVLNRSHIEQESEKLTSIAAVVDSYSSTRALEDNARYIPWAHDLKTSTSCHPCNQMETTAIIAEESRLRQKAVSMRVPATLKRLTKCMLGSRKEAMIVRMWRGIWSAWKSDCRISHGFATFWPGLPSSPISPQSLGQNWLLVQVLNGQIELVYDQWAWSEFSGGTVVKVLWKGAIGYTSSIKRRRLDKI